jgi:putative endopeptidase
VLLSFLEYLPPPYDDLHYELFEKLLKGSAEKLPQKYLTMKVLRTFAPQDLSRIFVDHAVPHETKAYASRLVEAIKEATIERIRAQTWMSPATKEIAIRKVTAMGSRIAYPHRWHSETAHVSMDATTPLGNILRLAEHDTERMMKDVGHRRTAADDEEWEDGAFEVNAYYYPEGNSIVMPAGILRSPFFDVKRSFAWNLGAIGVVIGHEITHGFDAEGRLYDVKGNYHDWWTKADGIAFQKRSRAVVKLFDDVPVLGGKVDGEQTLSENLADLGGMAIALEVLRIHVAEAVKKEGGDRKQILRDFFTSYAVSWRTKERPQKAKQSLLTDVHAPPKLRVNTVVHQFPEFYEAFDLGEKDEGWIPPEKRVTLW